MKPSRSVSAVSTVFGLLLASTLLNVTASAAPSTHEAVSAATTDADSNAIRVRTSFDLDATPDAIAYAAAHTADTSLLAIPLTAAEAAEVRRRDALGAVLGPLRMTLTGRAHFGGLWLDQAAGGVAVLAVTDDDPALVSLVEGRLPSGAQLRVTRTNTTLEDLNSQWQDALTYAGLHHEVLEVAENEPAGRVEVKVAESAGASALAAATAALPTAVVTVTSDQYQGGLDRFENSGHPVYGGAYIESPSFGCSATIGGTAGSNQPYLMTAGHCGHNTDAFTWGDHPYTPSRAIGSGHQNRTFGQPNNQTHCDCVIILMPNFNFVTGSVYTGGAGRSSQSTYTYTRAAINGGDYYHGRRTCFSGVTSGLQCGAMDVPGMYTYSNAGNVEVIGFITDFTMAHGDSGGPAGDGATFLGLFSGGKVVQGSNQLFRALISESIYFPQSGNFSPSI